MKKIKFDIGEWVKTKAIVYFNFGYKNEQGIRSNNKREMFRQEMKKKGRIVGMSYRNIGKMERSNCCDEPNTFKITKRILVYLVKEGMINKPFECLPEDLNISSAEEFPFCISHKELWTKKMRKELSEDSKTFPRDSKGRWI